MHLPYQVERQALPETADPTAEYQHVGNEKDFTSVNLNSTSLAKIGKL